MIEWNIVKIKELAWKNMGGSREGLNVLPLVITDDSR